MEIDAQSGTIIVTGTLDIPATPAETWAVLTDYDHMADFLPNIDYSKKLDGTKDKFRVEQKGRAYFGLLAFSFYAMREVMLMPYQEIRASLVNGVSGDFRRLDTYIRLVPDKGETFIYYRNESLPVIRLPNGMAAAIAEQTTRNQWASLKREIMRRKSLAHD